MFAEASLDAETRASKADPIAKHIWITTHIKQIDQFEDVQSPHTNPIREEAIEVEAIEEDTGHIAHHIKQTEIPLIGNVVHPSSRGSTAETLVKILTIAGMVLPTVVTHLTFGTQDPPIVPYMARCGTTAINTNTADQQNISTPLIEQRSALKLKLKLITTPFLSGLCYGPVHVGVQDPWTFVGQILLSFSSPYSSLLHLFLFSCTFPSRVGVMGRKSSFLLVVFVICC